MDIAQQLGQQWSQRIENEHPEINTKDRGAIVKWLLGESPERLTGQTEPDLAIAQRAIEYRYRILQHRYLNVNPNQGYKQLIKRLSSLFLIRSKIKVWISLSYDRRRTVVDVIQEVVQEMMRSDRHLAQELEWIATCTKSSRLRNLLMLASIEEYCLRPIRNQPLIIYRFVNYLRRSQKGGITQVPTGELIRLVSNEIPTRDGEDSLSLLDVEAWNQYQDEQYELEQQSLGHQVKTLFMNYLSRNLDDTAARFLELHLKGYSQEQIAYDLSLSMQQTYRLREKVNYHVIRIFALREQPQLVFEWIKTSLAEHNFGLTPSQWNIFWDDLKDDQKQILEYFREEQPVDEIEERLSLTTSKVQSTLTNLYLQSQLSRSHYEDVINEVEEVGKALDKHAVDEIEELKTALDNILVRSEFDYLVVMHFSSPRVRVGEEIKVSIDFWPVSGSLDCETHELSEGQIINFHDASDDLNIFLSAKDCLSSGSLMASLPSFKNVDKSSDARQSVEFKVIPIFSGSSEISIEIFDRKNFITRIANTLEIESLEEFNFISRLSNVGSRPVAHSDFFLYVKSSSLSEGVVSLEFFLRNPHLKSFPREIYSVTQVSRKMIDLFRRKVGDNMHSKSIFSCFDQEVSLSNIGYEIFHRIVPPEIRDCICSPKKYAHPFSISIFSSQDTWLPWEILHDGKGFLSDILIIGNWLLELDRDYPYEFSIGGIKISYYGSTTKPENWERVLSPVGSPLPSLLNDGMLTHLDQLNSLRGLHIAQSSNLRDCDNLEFPVSLTNSGELSEDISFEIRPAKLILRKNRPLVSLSFLQEETSQLSTIESTWAPAFIRAGASAFVGPLWSVDPAVDAAFISTFYTRLWMGDALGQAFHTARQMARIAVPESCDWLAYVLYGDPMARPYRPVEGKGYAVVEPIGQDINDPLPPNQSLRFRLTLRRDPPIWHEDRLIEVAEDLAFDNLHVHIVAFGLEVNSTTVDMSRTPNGNYLGWFTLSAPPTMAGETVPVQVHFADGAEPIHSVTFALHIAAEESE